MLADTQKRLEYIHSLQETICMNYRKMTEQEVTLEEKVCRHKSENDPTENHIIVVKLSFMHYIGTLRLFYYILVIDFFYTAVHVLLFFVLCLDAAHVGLLYSPLEASR